MAASPGGNGRHVASGEGTGTGIDFEAANRKLRRMPFQWTQRYCDLYTRQTNLDWRTHAKQIRA